MDKLTALICLLDDPDQNIAEQVSNEILAIGDKAIPQLEQIWEENSFEANFRDRVEDLIHEIQYRSVYGGLKRWVESPYDLLRGAYLISKYQYPELEFDTLDQQLEEIADKIRARIKNQVLPSRTIVAEINAVLFHELGFRSNKSHFHAPQNNYLSELLHSKKANPLLLSVLYVLIGERLNLPIVGVNLPNHFIVGFANETLPESPIIFYINPFNKGSLLSKQDLIVFLKEMNLPNKPEFIEACDNIAMVKRMLVNLIYSYNKLGHTEKIEELQKLQQVFD